MILLTDNYDSFSYNLYQLVGSLNPDVGAVMVTSGSPHAGSMRTSTFIFEPSPLHPQYRQKPAACLQICDRRPVFRDNWRGGRSKKARGGQLRGRAYRRAPAPGSSGSSRRATFR